MLVASYLQEKHMIKYVKVANILLIIRNAQRPFDIEQTRDEFELLESWFMLVN